MMVRCAAAAIVIAALAAAPARAALYDWTYGGDGFHSGSGTLTVTGSTVTAISGSFDGSGIIQLITDGSCCGAPGADNAFSATAPHLSGNGMAFETFGSPGFYDILWNAGAGSYSVLDDNGQLTFGGNFAVTAQGVGETRIPEPASLALLGIGIAGVMGLACTRQRMGA